MVATGGFWMQQDIAQILPLKTLPLTPKLPACLPACLLTCAPSHGDFWVQQDRAASFVEQPHPYLDWGHPSAATSSLDRAGSLELSEATQPQEQGQPPDP
jgi:hypothetical protein